jgi:hypothetical protein
VPDVETKLKREIPAEIPAEVWSPEPVSRRLPKRRLRIVPLLVTLVAIAVASVLGRATWNAYMGAAWTRDGTVRVYVVTIAPPVAGQIVQLPVAKVCLAVGSKATRVLDLVEIAWSLCAPRNDQHLSCHCEPTGPRSARPENKLREAIPVRAAGAKYQERFIRCRWAGPKAVRPGRSPYRPADRLRRRADAAGKRAGS